MDYVGEGKDLPNFSQFFCVDASSSGTILQALKDIGLKRAESDREDFVHINKILHCLGYVYSLTLKELAATVDVDLAS